MCIRTLRRLRRPDAHERDSALLCVTLDVFDKSSDGPLQVGDEVAGGGFSIVAHTRLEDPAMLPLAKLDGADFH